MGVAYNSRIVTDGLVACYDLGNTRRSYSPNAHPSGTNIYDWYVGIKGNNTASGSTISKDTTTSSPVGNTPLKMVVTGTDPHLQMYNNSVWNLGPAAVGETWVVSVYVKATINTTAQLFMFGANSSGGVFSPSDYSASTINVTTEWTRIQHVHTFQNAATNYIQIRLDGPDTQAGGDALGQEIWWDGLQVERGSTPSNFTSDYTGGNVLDISKNSNNGTIVSSPQYNSSNGGYITFDDVNDYIGIGKTSGDLGIYDGSYTFEAWVYPTNISAVSGDNAIFGTDQAVLRQALHLVFRNINIYQGHFSADYSSGTVSANQWYHIVWTYNKISGGSTGTARIYKNGELQGNPGTINSFIGDTEILIGRWRSINYFAGRGAQYRIYNRALTASEVLQNFDAQRARYEI